MDFGSWTYDTSQLDLDWWLTDDWKHTIPYVDFNDYVKSNEWFTDGENEKDLSKLYKIPIHQRKNQIRSLKRLRVANFTTADGQ